MTIRPHLSRVLVGTLLIPVVFGALVLWSLNDRAGRTDQVPAAVVNLDQPVTQGTGKDKQIIAAGRLLAAGLTSPTKQTRSNLGWQLTNEEDARQGLADGDYYAVITIPEDFSRSLSSVTKDDPQHAELSVQGNDSSSALVAEASRQVADVAAAKLGHRVTKTYLKGIFSRTDELRLKLGKASDAAGKVADGANEVAEGARQVDGGASELAGGLGTLSDGADQLGGGAGRLADGATELARGVDRLADGAGRLDRGTGRLAYGLGKLEHRTDPLPRQTDRLADGAGQVADGAAAYAGLVIAWKDACLTAPVVAAARPQLCAATVQAAGARGENADQLRSGARQVAIGARRLADGMPQLTDAIGQAAGGAERLARGTTRLADGADRAATGTARLAAGAQRLAGGAGRLAGGADLARDGAVQLADGSARLGDGSVKLGDGSQRLATGLADGAGQIPASGDDAARVVADPVATVASSLNPQREGSTLLAPAVLALGLWLGAFVTYLVRRALPGSALRAARPTWRLTLEGWLPAVAVGAGQAALLLLGALAFGARFASPVGVSLLLLVCAAAFTAVNQAFVALLGPRRGWIVAIAFTALQAVSLGGLVPIDTAPRPLQLLHAVLPVPRAADGFAHVTLGGLAGSPRLDAVVVVAWGLAALATTSLMVRRRQRLSLDDVRREVSAEEPERALR
ncbi:MAG: YhgE/Pip family protein [Nocardioides sp.]